MQSGHRTAPIAANADMVRPDMVDTYLGMLFGYVDFGAGDSVRLRGVPETGTPLEGTAAEVIVLPGAPALQGVVGPARRWAQYGRATYMVPAVMGAGDLERDIRLFTTLCVDIDKGDTDAKLAYLTQHLGRPTMVVHSGGHTEHGQPKLHLYWRLTEPTDDVELVAALRAGIAEAVDGDPSFGRAAQIIRVPGTVYGKGGTVGMCTIRAHDPAAEYELDDLRMALEEIRRMPGLPPPAPKQRTAEILPFGAFSREERVSRAASVLSSDIAAGGQGAETRWANFGVAAGHFIYEARQGLITPEEARERAFAWAVAHMRPVWPEARLDSEWRALVALDARGKGPIPPPPAVVHQQIAAAATSANLFDAWMVGEGGWITPDAEVPRRRWLVSTVIPLGDPVLFVAQGGVGKTYALIDLVLTGAGWDGTGAAPTWFGKPLSLDAANKVWVLLTSEDSYDEIKRRVAELDPDGRRRRLAGQRLRIVPTVAMPNGQFTFAERDRTGNVKDSQRWIEIRAHLRAIPNLGFVAFDTLNAFLHGDENSALTVAEFRRAAFGELCEGRNPVTVLLTHHLRKTNEKVDSPDAMLNAVRGSGAFGAAFRMVLGAWEALDYEKRMAAMKLAPEPRSLYRFAVLKANNPEAMRETRTLIRHKDGYLVDATAAQAPYEEAQLKAGGHVHQAWLLAAIEHAAAAGSPFKVTAAVSGLYARRAQLPPAISGLGKHTLQAMAWELERDGRIVTANIATDKSWLDVPTGPLARFVTEEGLRYELEKGAYVPPRWHEYLYNQRTGFVEKDTGNAR